MKRFKVTVVLEIETDDPAAFLEGSREESMTSDVGKTQDGNTLRSAKMTITDETGAIVLEESKRA